MEAGREIGGGGGRGCAVEKGGKMRRRVTMWKGSIIGLRGGRRNEREGWELSGGMRIQ